MRTLIYFFLTALFLNSYSYSQAQVQERPPAQTTNGKMCQVAYSEGGSPATLEFRYTEQAPPRSPFRFDHVVKYIPTGAPGQIVGIVAQVPNGKLEDIFPGHQSNDQRVRETAEANILSAELLFRLCLTEQRLVELAVDNTVLRSTMGNAMEAAYQAGLAKGTVKAEEIFTQGYVTGVVVTIQRMNQLMNRSSDWRQEASYSSSVSSSGARVGFQTHNGALTPNNGTNSSNGDTSTETAGSSK